MTLKIGLTGSIGMGKSTTARFFHDAGLPLWDADAAVHDLYAPDAPGTRAISELYPPAASDKGVDRTALRAAIQADPALLKQVEAVIHPLVAAHRKSFLKTHAHTPAVVFDIPLLFETGAEQWLDHVVVVSAPPEVQKQRVLERPGMTEEAFALILSKQTPDAEKRAKADTVIDTSQGLEPARAAVLALLETLGVAKDA